VVEDARTTYEDVRALSKMADAISNLRAIAMSPPAGWFAERKLGYLEGCRKLVDTSRGADAALERIFDETAADVERAKEVRLRLARPRSLHPPVGIPTATRPGRLEAYELTLTREFEATSRPREQLMLPTQQFGFVSYFGLAPTLSSPSFRLGTAGTAKAHPWPFQLVSTPAFSSAFCSFQRGSPAPLPFEGVSSQRDRLRFALLAGFSRSRTPGPPV
jgi:hypothetical protein